MLRFLFSSTRAFQSIPRQSRFERNWISPSFVALVMVSTAGIGWVGNRSVIATQEICRETTASLEQDESQTQIRSLFDGESLEGWKSSQFGGDGEVEIRDGAIVLGMGYPLTGITSRHEGLPTADYEICVEAKRIEGDDFFCCLTFPVNDSHASLVVGGWGGSLVGIS